ncbi:VC0807 family protein [Actinoplanes sp. NPDC051851]|uniref:VC0807 family protein n=1 Tax=Actinoplanes sp. NPDC051851 TaxID=3154753 RepID=UPI00344A96FB
MERHQGMTAMIRSLAYDLGLPVITYYGLHALGASDSAALFAGTIAAGLRLAWSAIRTRTLNHFSSIMAAVFGVGLLFTLLTGDPRFLLIKHSVMSAVIGILFVVTALRGSKPLTLSAQQSFAPAKAAELAQAYATTPRIRHGHRVASLVWGAGLLTEAALRIVLVYLLPVSVMVGLSTILTITTFTLLIAWNARYIATHAGTAPAAPSTSVPAAATRSATALPTAAAPAAVTPAAVTPAAASTAPARVPQTI